MRFQVRISLLALIATTFAVGVSAPAAQAALGIEKFFAGNCKVNTCKKNLGETKEEEKTKAEAEGFTQAGGHPNFGVTDFTVNTVSDGHGHVAPTGTVTHVRTDVAPGVSTNPQAVPMCSPKEFGEVVEFGGVPLTGLYPEPKCKAETIVGEEKVVVYAGTVAGDVPIEGKTYNLPQPKGLSSLAGTALELPIPLTEAKLNAIFHGTEPAVETAQYYSHTLIEGNVEWGAQARGTGKADYHDYFEVEVSPELPLISSRLIFKGNIGTGAVPHQPDLMHGLGTPDHHDADADCERRAAREGNLDDAHRVGKLQPRSVRARFRADARNHAVRSARRHHHRILPSAQPQPGRKATPRR